MRTSGLLVLFSSVLLPAAARGQLRKNSANGESVGALGDSSVVPIDEDRRLESPQGLAGFRTVMKSGSKSGKFKNVIFPGEPRTAYNKQCKLELTDEGDLATYKLIKGKYKMTWRSGGQGRKGDFVTMLQKDGNLVTRDVESGENVWSTLSHDPQGILEGAEYFLFFEEGSDMLCHLTIWKFQEEHDGTHTSNAFKRWWSNVHSVHSEMPARGSIEPMDYVLQRGEIQSDGRFSMMLDLDCQLVVFRGTDLSDIRKIVWTTDAPPKTNDCHLFARRKDPSTPDDEGEIILYHGPYNRNIQNGYEDRGSRYWDRKVDERDEDGSYFITVTKKGPVAKHFGK